MGNSSSISRGLWEPWNPLNQKSLLCILLLAARRARGEVSSSNQWHFSLIESVDWSLHTKHGNLLKSSLISLSSWLFDFSMRGVIFGSGYQIWHFCYAWLRPIVTSGCFPQARSHSSNPEPEEMAGLDKAHLTGPWADCWSMEVTSCSTCP